jgi:hypothetical protein
MRFQHETGSIHTVDAAEIQGLRFIDSDVFVVYTAGDCDVFLPYVELKSGRNVV